MKKFMVFALVCTAAGFVACAKKKVDVPDTHHKPDAKVLPKEGNPDPKAAETSLTGHWIGECVNQTQSWVDEPDSLSTKTVLVIDGSQLTENVSYFMVEDCPDEIDLALRSEEQSREFKIDGTNLSIKTESEEDEVVSFSLVDDKLTLAEKVYTKHVH